MSKDDIIKMAREAWFPEELLTDNMVFLLERFAAVEREACAKLVDDMKTGTFATDGWYAKIAKDIRARGEK